MIFSINHRYRIPHNQNWVKKKQLYNTRFDEPVDVERIGAKYLLLYDLYNGEANTKTYSIYRIIDNPEIWDKNKMIREDYPSPSRQEYFIYTIEPINESWIENKVWDISKLDKYKKTKPYGPFSVSLSELMRTTIK